MSLIQHSLQDCDDPSVLTTLQRSHSHPVFLKNLIQGFSDSHADISGMNSAIHLGCFALNLMGDFSAIGYLDSALARCFCSVIGPCFSYHTTVCFAHSVTALR